jgi:hypothetical protein
MSHGHRSSVRASQQQGREVSATATADKEESSHFSGPRILAGALGAACSAFACSWLGVGGTVTGAVVASVVASVGTAIYTTPIERSRDAIQRGSRVVLDTIPMPVTRASTYVGDELVETRAFATEPAPSGELGGTREIAAVTPESSRSASRRFTWSNASRQWRVVLITAAVTLVAGFGVLTGFELIVGKSVASITDGSNGGTTLGHLFPGNSGNHPKNTQTPSTALPTTQVPTSEPATSSAPSTSAPDSSTTPSTSTGTSSPTTPTTPTTGTTSPSKSSPGTH